VDNVAKRLEEKAQVANARFDRAVGDLNTQDEGDVATALAKQKIAERRAKLAGDDGQK